MIQITLICAAGMSTNLLVRKMREYSNTINLDCKIIAMSIENFKDYTEETDVCLLGPHIGYRLEEVENMYKNKFMIDVIDMADYGMLNGSKVVQHALLLLEKERGTI